MCFIISTSPSTLSIPVCNRFKNLYHRSTLSNVVVYIISYLDTKLDIKLKMPPAIYISAGMPKASYDVRNHRENRLCHVLTVTGSALRTTPPKLRNWLWRLTTKLWWYSAQTGVLEYLSCNYWRLQSFCNTETEKFRRLCVNGLANTN